MESVEVEIIKSKTQETRSKGGAHPGHKARQRRGGGWGSAGVWGGVVTKRKLSETKTYKHRVGIEMQTQRNKELQRCRWARRHGARCAAAVLLYVKAAGKGRQKFPTNTHACTWTNANRSRRTLAAMFRILMHPRGTLVLPPSSICETIQGPGEKECTGQVRTAFQRDRRGGKKWFKSDKDPSHTNAWDHGTIFHILCWLAGVYFATRYTTLPNNAFIQLGENCIQVTERKKKMLTVQGQIAESRGCQACIEAPFDTVYTLISGCVKRCSTGEYNHHWLMWNHFLAFQMFDKVRWVKNEEHEATVVNKQLTESF